MEKKCKGEVRNVNTGKGEEIKRRGEVRYGKRVRGKTDREGRLKEKVRKGVEGGGKE